MLTEAGAAIVICGDRSIEEMDSYLLQNCSAATQNMLLAAHDLGLGPAAGKPGAAPGQPQPSAPSAPAAAAAEAERAAIARALAKWQGNRTKAAEDLGISRRTILYKIKRYGL